LRGAGFGDVAARVVAEAHEVPGQSALGFEIDDDTLRLSFVGQNRPEMEPGLTEEPIIRMRTFDSSADRRGVPRAASQTNRQGLGQVVVGVAGGDKHVKSLANH
jgi:hypothetical protein